MELPARWRLGALLVLAGNSLEPVAAMRLVHPLPDATLITDDLVVAIEFMHGLGPSDDLPLWVRFDGPGNTTGEDRVFSK